MNESVVVEVVPNTMLSCHKSSVCWVIS